MVGKEGGKNLAIWLWIIGIIAVAALILGLIALLQINKQQKLESRLAPRSQSQFSVQCRSCTGPSQEVLIGALEECNDNCDDGCVLAPYYSCQSSYSSCYGSCGINILCGEISYNNLVGACEF